MIEKYQKLKNKKKRRNSKNSLASDDVHDLELIENAALCPVEMIGRGVLIGWVAGGFGV